MVDDKARSRRHVAAGESAAGGQRDAPRSRRWFVGVACLALLALGAGALLVASSLDEGRPRVVGPNAAVAAGAADPRDIGAHNSPTVVANPRDGANLFVVNRIDTPSFSCALHVSADAGATWAPTQLPFPEGEERPERCFAPDAAFAADGTLHVSFVTLAGRGNVPNAAWVASSTDGGRSLGTPARVTGPNAFQVRLAADPADPARLYASWLQARAVSVLGFPEAGNPVVVARSDDGGRTWSSASTVSDRGRSRVLAPSVAVGANGRVHVLYLDVGDDRLDYHGAHQGRGGPPYPGPWSLVAGRSDDAGTTWTETVVDDELVPAERIVALFPQVPSLAVEGRRVYAAFHDAREAPADVWLWASTDAGVTFGAARRVNDTPPPDGTWQYLPRLAVAPDGRLDVVYYDRRADPEGIMNEVSLQSSHDGGRTFGPRVRVSDRAFDSRIGFGSERDLPDLGSRLGVIATDRRTLALWADTRAGSQASNKQVLAKGVVAHPGQPPVPVQPVRLAGLAALAAGLLGLAWWATGADSARGRDRAAAGAETGPPQLGRA